MTWCHHYQVTLKARHIPGCLNVMADLLFRPNQVKRMVTASTGVQTDLSKWFTRHVDLFATRLNHKVPLYISPVPDQDALNINWSGFTAYAYPPMALIHRVIQKNQTIQLSDHCIPGRKSGILRIQYGHAAAAAAAEISFWTR